MTGPPQLHWLSRCCLVAALVFCLPSGGVAADDAPTRLRVLSYNIHHGRGSDDKVDLERIARVINEARPDLVALQEVDSGVKRSARVDEPRQLAELTKLDFVFGDNIPYEGGRYGNAVLSRFPILRHKNHPLPSHYKGEQRGVLEVEVQPPDGLPPLTFYATHFDYRGDYDVERIDSAKLVNELVARKPDALAILAGDLNALPDSKPLQVLAAHWTRDPRVTPTFPAAGPTRQIDYVLFRPANRWCVVETRVLDEPAASDHRPLLVVLELRPLERAAEPSN